MSLTSAIDRICDGCGQMIEPIGVVYWMGDKKYHAGCCPPAAMFSTAPTLPPAPAWDEAVEVAIAQIRKEWQALPNHRTDSALTSFQQNAVGPGVGFAVNVLENLRRPAAPVTPAPDAAEVMRALEPFAKVGAAIPEDWPDGMPIRFSTCDTDFSCGQLRAALRAFVAARGR